jgi:exopolysaccharide production protein ExoQ
MPTTNYRFDTFLSVYLLMVGGSLYFLFYFLEGADAAGKAGETITYQIVWFVLYLLLITKLAMRKERIGSLLFSSGFFLAFLCTAATSLLANHAEIDSLIKFGMYLMTVAFAAWIVTNYNDPVDQVLETLYRLGIVVIVIHVLAYPIGREIVWDPLDRPTLLGNMPYAGLFGHKNLAGSYFAMTALICTAKFLSPECNNRSLSLILVLMNVALLVVSGAVGALVSFSVAAALTVGVYFFIERKVDLAAAFLLVAASITLVTMVHGVSNLFAFIGRDDTFTGRIELWSLANIFFWRHPLLGYGYANFFTADGASSIFWSMVPGQIKYWSFDNSYIEIGIQFGMIGGFFFSLILLRGIQNAFRFSINVNSAYKLGPLALLSYILVSSFFDSYLVLHNYIACVIIFWTYFGLQPTTSKEAASTRAARFWQWRQQKMAFRLGHARNLHFRFALGGSRHRHRLKQ